MTDAPKYIACATDDATQLGGKAAGLASLNDAAVSIPEWFVVAPSALRDSLSPDEWDDLKTGPSSGEALSGLSPTDAVTAAIEDALDRLPGDAFAVRSSARHEDGDARSFAGQLDSFLFVSREDVPARVADVWKSAWNARHSAYDAATPSDSPSLRSADDSLPAVLVQCMIDADVSGVAFSADPVNGRRSVAVVSAVQGTADALVSGRDDGATFRVDRDGSVIERPDASGASIVDDALVKRVAEMARAAARHRGAPQDVEWAVKNGTLYLLQSRPITTLGNQPDPDAPVTVWDDSNISESYSGVTTPLTFSFARRAYASVYRTFVRTLGVPQSEVEAHADSFDRMIGLVRGRIYYDLGSWYTVLSLLPGFRFNRRFMEEMMGVREQMPDALLPNDDTGPVWERVGDLVRMTRSLVKMARWHRAMPSRAETFVDEVNALLDASPGDLSTMRLDELAGYYGALEDELLQRWTVPIVNDFLTMIFAGASKAVLTAWTGADASTHGRLLRSQTELISAEPARRIRELAERVAGDDDLTGALQSGDPEDVDALLASRPDVKAEVDAYVDRFGDRCLGELKLESPTLCDDPRPFYRAVGGLAERYVSGASEVDAQDASLQDDARLDPKAWLDDELSGQPVRRRVLTWLLKHARERTADREQLRFARTRVFGRVREIVLEMGRRLAESGVLETPRDVFYLTLDELMGSVDGTSSPETLPGVVDARRETFSDYEDALSPPGRFRTHGAVASSPLTAAPASATVTEEVQDEQDEDVRSGLGCSPGTVRGPVRIVRDPQTASVSGDEILVADRTDPGWVSLFANCRGLIVAHGNLLSHAAIVAREIDLPGVVGISDALDWLSDGDWVEVDGQSGTVRRIEAPSATSGVENVPAQTSKTPALSRAA